MSYEQFAKQVHDERMSFPDACHYAVETFDNQPDLERATQFLRHRFRHKHNSSVLRTMLKAAQTVGYDNSEGMIKAIAP